MIPLLPINITNGLTCEGEVDVSGHGAVLGLPELVVQPLDELAGQRHDDGLRGRYNIQTSAGNEGPRSFHRFFSVNVKLREYSFPALIDKS